MTNVFFSDKYCASCNKRYANGVKVAAGDIFSPDSSDLPMLPYTVCKKCHKMATSASAAPSGTAAQIQAASGLTSFDEVQFNVTAGWASIKDGGIAHSKISDVTTGTVLGRLTVTDGPIEQLTFKQVVDNGIETTITGEANKIVKTTVC